MDNNFEIEKRSVENKSTENILIFMVMSIGALALGNGVGALSSTLASALEAGVCLTFVFFNYLVTERIKFSTLVLTFLSLLIIILNQATYMVSATMMILLIDFVRSNPEINYRRVLQIYFIEMSTLFVLVVLANRFFGIGTNNVTMWRIDSIIFRESLGFSYPNTTMIFWLSIVCSFVGIIRTRYKLYGCLLALSTWILYIHTYSRSSTYLILIACAAVVFWGHRLDVNVSSRTRTMLALLPIILLFVSLVVLFVPTSQALNSLLSGRINLYKSFYASYGINILRTQMLENAMFDNSYLQSLLAKGILYTTELMGVMVYMCRISRRISMRQIIVLAIYFAVAFTETTLQHFELFIPVILVLGPRTSETQFNEKKQK